MQEKPQEYVVSASHIVELSELVSRYGIDSDQFLSECGLRRRDLENGANADVKTLCAAVNHARSRTGEPAIGYLFGHQMRVTSHGYLGFAVLTASTLRDALNLALRFQLTRTSALRLSSRQIGTRTALEFETLADLGDAEEPILVAIVVGIWRIAAALTDAPLTGEVEFEFSEPSYFSRFSSTLPGTLRFGANCNRLLFDSHILDLPVKMADTNAQQLALAQCESELAALCSDGVLLRRVRAALITSEGIRSQREIAGLLALSVRTFRRRLAAAGTNYSALLEEERKSAAQRLLVESDASIEAIAERLGYAEPASFTRAFRRWLTTTPAAWRRQRRETAEPT